MRTSTVAVLLLGLCAATAGAATRKVPPALTCEREGREGKRRDGVR
jgi:hypothetical protein